MLKSHPGWCGASSVDVFILVCFVCIRPNRRRSLLTGSKRVHLAPVGTRWEADGTRSNIGRQRLVLLIWLIGLPRSVQSVGRPVAWKSPLHAHKHSGVLSPFEIPPRCRGLPLLFQSTARGILKALSLSAIDRPPESLFTIRSERRDPRPSVSTKRSKDSGFPLRTAARLSYLAVSSAPALYPRRRLVFLGPFASKSITLFLPFRTRNPAHAVIPFRHLVGLLLPFRAEPAVSIMSWKACLLLQRADRY